MRIAVLSLTRNRLDYSKHCFSRLQEYAGLPFDHFILDQGSTDGTPAWLKSEYKPKGLMLLPENIGISQGMNQLLDLAGDRDVYVKLDNDCELTDKDTFPKVLELLTDKLILSPKVQGLSSPPPIHTRDGRLGFLAQLGGIFMAVPGWVFEQYRYPAGLPTWGMDDVDLSAWFTNKGGRVAYIMDMAVNHYETTAGQWERFPEYFEQKKREGLPL
jgi:GT2 family glycosyltransferase